MSTDTVFLIGAAVHASDGHAGKLVGLVVAPDSRRLTHLAVEPTRHRSPGRLVPLGMVTSCIGDVVLSCTVSEFGGLPQADDARSGPTVHGHFALPRPPVLAAARTMGLGLAADDTSDTHHGGLETSGSVPCGEDEICSGRHVLAADGGHFRGLAVGMAGRISGLLLDQSRPTLRRRVNAPVEAVTAFGGVIRTDLTRDQIKALPTAGRPA
jgi:hypothetical protein